MKHLSLIVMLVTVATCGFGQDKTTELNELLLRAVAERNLQSVRDCLGRGVSPNSMDVHGQTALCLAAQRGPVELVKLLLDRGADPNLPSKNDVENPLVTVEIRLPVAGSGGTEILEMKDSGHLYSNTEMTNGYSALMIAVNNGAMDIVSLLLQKGANPNYRGILIPKVPAPSQDLQNGAVKTWENTALSLAAATGAKARALAELLLKSGAEVDCGNQGTGIITPLMIASRDGNLELVELLIRNKANVNAKERTSNRTPLAFALQGRRRDVARLLLKQGADIREYDYAQIAFESGDEEVLDLLIQKGVDIHGREYLRKAAERGSVPLTEVLLKHGAAVDGGSTGAKTPTPLMIASRAGNYELAKLLVEHGANVNARDEGDGSTPLILAMDRLHNDLARMLLDNGAAADAGTTGAHIPTPLMRASHAGNLEQAKLLVEHGADVNARNEGDGSTPLILAVRGGYNDVAEMLLDNGAVVGARTKDRTTAAWIAVNTDNAEMARILRKHGAWIPDRLRWLFVDVAVSPIVRTVDGEYFADFESGFGVGARARLYFGSFVGVLVGGSYEYTGNAYLGSTYDIGFSNFALEVGVFARDRNGFVQGYGIMATTGTTFANGPAGGKFSRDEDAGGELSLEAGVRVKAFPGIGVVLFVKQAAYAYYPGPIPEDGSVTTAGLGISYQFWPQGRH